MYAYAVPNPNMCAELLEWLNNNDLIHSNCTPLLSFNLFICDLFITHTPELTSVGFQSP